MLTSAQDFFHSVPLFYLKKIKIIEKHKIYVPKPSFPVQIDWLKYSSQHHYYWMAPIYKIVFIMPISSLTEPVEGCGVLCMLLVVTHLHFIDFKTILNGWQFIFSIALSPQGQLPLSCYSRKWILSLGLMSRVHESQSFKNPLKLRNVGNWHLIFSSLSLFFFHRFLQSP